GAQKDPSALPRVTGFTCPKYPSNAESMRLSGTVRMDVTTDGHQVVEVKISNGAHPVRAQAAEKTFGRGSFRNTLQPVSPSRTYTRSKETTNPTRSQSGRQRWSVPRMY